MLNFTGALKVFVAVQPADLRKSFSGLYALTANVLNERPDSGGLFVFTNQRRNRVTALYYFAEEGGKYTKNHGSLIILYGDFGIA